MNETPGERPPTTPRLPQPPSDRYGQTPPAEPSPAADGSLARSIGFALPAAAIAVLVYVALAGPLAFSAGLVIVAIFAGRVIGMSARAGGGRVLTPDRRVVVALLVTLSWYVVAQAAVWLYARSEGGVLPMGDYLLQTFGPIVPLVAIASVLAAWWSAR